MASRRQQSPSPAVETNPRVGAFLFAAMLPLAATTLVAACATSSVQAERWIGEPAVSLESKAGEPVAVLINERDHIVWFYVDLLHEYVDKTGGTDINATTGTAVAYRLRCVRAFEIDEAVIISAQTEGAGCSRSVFPAPERRSEVSSGAVR